MERENSRLGNDELTEVLISQICRQLSKRNWSLKMLATMSDKIKRMLKNEIQQM